LANRAPKQSSKELFSFKMSNPKHQATERSSETTRSNTKDRLNKQTKNKDKKGYKRKC
jgi:hypothetical protein